jgi:hypothetical protein
MAAITHPYRPAHMTRTSFGNVKPCCGRPEADHPVWVAGEQVRIRLTREAGGGTYRIPRGTIVTAMRETYSGMQEVRPDKWGTVPSTGLIGMLEKGEYRDVPMPGYNIPTPQGYSIGVPDTYGKEV